MICEKSHCDLFNLFRALWMSFGSYFVIKHLSMHVLLHTSIPQGFVAPFIIFVVDVEVNF